MHNALITVHTIAGLCAFVTGVMLVQHPRRARDRQRVARTYFAGLIVLAATTAAVVQWDWPSLNGGERTAFAGLIGLATVMIGRAALAREAMSRASQHWEARFVDAIGFTLISLFDGFVIIAALDLGGPPWLVAVAGVAGVLIGRRAVHHARERATAGTR